MMNCRVHPEREAHALCVACGQPACAECLVTLHGQEYCRTCLEQLVAGQVPEPAPAEGADLRVASGTAGSDPISGPRVLGAQGAAPQSVPGEMPFQGTAPQPAQEPTQGPTQGPTQAPDQGAAPPGASQAYTPPPLPPEGPSLAGKSDGLATVLGLFPGLGHLYLGIKVRGLQLLVGFILAKIVIGILGLDGFLEPWFSFAAIFFSVFEVRESIGRLRRGQPVKDEPLMEVGAVRDPQRMIAYGLIGLGVLALLRTMLNQWEIWLTRLGWNVYNAERGLMAILLIVVGVWLLTGGFRRKES